MKKKKKATSKEISKAIKTGRSSISTCMRKLRKEGCIYMFRDGMTCYYKLIR